MAVTQITRDYCCPNCGAPVLSEVCQYCGTYLEDAHTKDLTAEYVMIRCKLAKFTFFGTIFPMIFMLAFLVMPSVFVILAAFGEFDEESWQIYLLMVPFYLVGIGAGITLFKNVGIVLGNKFKGKILDGTVYGYMDDVVTYNGNNGQQVKVLVYSEGKYKFVLLPLGDTTKPYEVNSNIKLRLYKNTAVVVEDKVKLQW